MSCQQKLMRIPFASLLLFATRLLGQSIPPLPTNLDPSGYVGNEACARCHSSIAESYKRTAMARASGPQRRTSFQAISPTRNQLSTIASTTRTGVSG